MENLGRKIRQERKSLGLTLERFAEIIGTSKATLQRIETGAKSPSVALLAEISHFLKKPLDNFIKDETRGFYKLLKKNQKVIATKDFRMVTICPFGLIYKDIVVNHFKAEAGAFIKPHRNKGYEWIYVLKGSAILEHAGNQYKVTKGDVLYYDAREIHSVKFLTDHESIDIFIRT